ncbi:non-hydrolyzing UDP-N-acetylglucosamine 2-epimerase [Candidatus Zixiibacteriota bacterium]
MKDKQGHRRLTESTKPMENGARIAIVLGTRPEIIKMCPVIRACQQRGDEFILVHTEQHHKYEMDKVFFDDLQLPAPHYRLGIGSGTHGKQTGKLLIGIEEVLLKERPAVVLVQGDTNTVLAGALAAAKLHIPLGHVEAGLRSYDRRMPEELNRVLADHASEYLFAPTEEGRNILLGEGIPEDKIFVTGNTIVDAIQQNLEIARRSCDPLKTHRLKPRGYIVVTAHRPENVDHQDNLKELLSAIDLVQRQLSIPLICSLHPRTKSMIERFGLQVPENIVVIKPLGFLEFLQLEANASLILTDSGGMQEEACILGVPCVTLRDNTERPETVAVGANVLAGIQPRRVLSGVKEMLGKNGGWSNPFGDGTSGARIVDLISNRPGSEERATN